MRQGDGSDVLGPGDPRNSDIGILYVEARDSRQAILTAINTQEVQGRKQIAIVLPEQGKAFRHPLDFDGLKNIRRQLRAQLIFIVPSGHGPAELARQRRFTVYSSLATFKSALLSKDISMANPRAKSRPGLMKRPGILDFGGRKASTNKPRVPVTPRLLQAAPPTPRLRNQAAPPTPRLHDQPTPLIMPHIPPTPSMQRPYRPEQAVTQAMPPMSPTPRVLNQPAAQDLQPTPGVILPNQRGLSNVPPTPHLPDQFTQAGAPVVPPTPHLPEQWKMPTPRINEMHTTENSAAANAPGTPSHTQNIPEANDLFTDERMAAATAGILAGNSLESDEDALYAPPASQQQEAFAQHSPDSASPTNNPRSDKLPLENMPTPSIIAFPTEQITPKTTDQHNTTSDSASSSKSDVLHGAYDPASLITLPGEIAPTPNLPGRLPDGSGKLPTAPHPATTPTTAGPVNISDSKTPGGENTGKFAASGTLETGMIFGRTGKSTVPGGVNMTGQAGTVSNVSGSPGSFPAHPLYRRTILTSSPPTNQSGAQAPAAQWNTNHFRSNSMSPRPSGLTPLPPPYSRRARRKRNRTLLLLALLFLLCALTVVGVFAQHSQMSGGLRATVTLTPANKLETDNYLLSALPTGTPDPAHLQIAARLLTQNSGAATTTASATGSIAAKAATGTLVFFNSTSSSITLGSTTFTGKDGVQIRFNGPVFVPATGSASASTQGYALTAGSQGNIPAFDIGGPCCASGITVKNTSPFIGGQDAQQNSVVQQSDLDNAARPVISKLTKITGAALQKQVRSGERVVDNTFQCKPTITSDHKVGDIAKTASVQVTAICTEEVYDFAAAQQIATSRLQTRESNDPALNSQYILNGHIVANILSNTVVSGSGQATIEVQAKGLWVYQITNQMQQSIKQSLLKLPQADAQSVLARQLGVASAQINISGGSSLPDNPNAIMLVVQQLPGPQSTPGNASSEGGSPTVIPSGTGIPAGPALTPTLTPVPGLGKARLH